MNTLLYPTIEQEQLQRLLRRKTEYLQRLSAGSKQAPYVASEIAVLRDVYLCLAANQNIVMSDLVKDITAKLSEASRLPGAERLNGLLYYYRMQEPDEERRNLVALTGGGPRDEVRIKDMALYDGYEECEVELIRL